MPIPIPNRLPVIVVNSVHIHTHETIHWRITHSSDNVSSRCKVSAIWHIVDCVYSVVLFFVNQGSMMNPVKLFVFSRYVIWTPLIPFYVVLEYRDFMDNTVYICSRSSIVLQYEMKTKMF